MNQIKEKCIIPIAVLGWTALEFLQSKLPNCGSQLDHSWKQNLNDLVVTKDKTNQNDIKKHEYKIGE